MDEEIEYEDSDNEVMQDDDDPDDFLSKETDPFTVHFDKDLPEEFVEELSSKRKWEKKEIKIQHVGKGFSHWPNSDFLPCFGKKEKDLRKLHVKQRLCKQVMETNVKLCNTEKFYTEDGLSPLQHGLFSVLNTYQDVYFPGRNHHNGEEIRLVYCLHALNHVLKTRSRVIAHNTKLKTKQLPVDADTPRDQGLTRPKVLIILPFRQSAVNVVEILTSLLMPDDQLMVSNKKRFKSEFCIEGSDDNKRGLKPEDYEALFTGNTDDHFRVGISVAKKALKLYVPFYFADIILASPLGVRTIIGAEGEKDRDYDFLSSIEVLILDQADIFLMQNWDHILQLFNHMHLQPKEAHGVDFSRVRMWMLNGWAKLYRQSIILSSLALPEINAVFNKHCHNYSGKIQFLRQHTGGTVCQIILQLPQMFHKIDCASYSQLADTHFDFFIKKVLPHHKDPVMSQTLIFVPSYFDFVRLRNYFKREEVAFVHINEYASERGMSKARSLFYHGKTHFMLYTERLHFYRRFKLRGIKHVIFYELPHYPHFYSELCNMIKDVKKDTQNENATCTVIYSKYDVQRLVEVVGTDRAAVMLDSKKSIHMFVTGEDS